MNITLTTLADSWTWVRMRAVEAPGLVDDRERDPPSRESANRFAAFTRFAQWKCDRGASAVACPATSSAATNAIPNRRAGNFIRLSCQQDG